MPKLIPKNEATLRAILKIGDATLHDVEAIVGDVAKEAINSLFRCEFLSVVATKSMLTKGRQTKDMHVYAITDKGRNKLQDADTPPLKKDSLPISKHPQNLHKMEALIIPARDPNVRQMMAEIGGRMVKITYGVHHAYEAYVPPLDQSRNYKPRPIRGILA